ncbi:MAG: hypothetical protein K2X27_17400 [Candidatus Obscuribacterales bacterium]|nr:hypothetical protein [Candidatus Obscuribacterales bacterium]
MQKKLISLFVLSWLAFPAVFAQDGSFAGRFQQRRNAVSGKSDRSMDWDLRQPERKSSLFPDSSAVSSGPLFPEQNQNPAARLKTNIGSLSAANSKSSARPFSGVSAAGQNFRREGKSALPNGSQLSRDPVNNSLSISRKDGLGFQSNADGSKVFKRSNGLETVRTPDGRVYMRDSKTGQPTGRELIK